MSDLLHVRVQGRTPPGQWRYTFPEDGFMVKQFCYDDWLRKIKAHYEYNSYPMPDNWVELAEDQLCKLLPAGQCEHEDGSKPEYFVSLQFGLNDAINGTKVLAGWTTSGFPLVSKEVAKARGKTCASCYANVTLPGCGTCQGFASLVAEIVGATPLDSDPILEGKSCAYCHCASKANIWVPVEVSKSGVSQQALEAMPKDWCWKRREILALSTD